MVMPAVAESFAGFVSTMDLFATLTALFTVVPFSRLASVAATSVTVWLAPAARLLKVTVCGLGRARLQTPAVDLQETNDSPVGRLSTRVADAAVVPLLVTVIV